MRSINLRHFIEAWFTDHLYRRLLRNASWLTGASFISGLLGLASIALTARILGPEEFGILALVTAYSAIIDRLINFQSWQFLIKNGAEALHDNNHPRFRRQIKFSALLDAGSAVASTAVAVGFAGIAGLLIGWSQHEIHLAMAYSLTILFNLSGMPTGVLRLFDQFRTLAAQKILQSVFNVVGVIVVWSLGGGLLHFLLAFALSNIAGNLYLLSMGWVQIRRQKIFDVWNTPLAGFNHAEPGAWRFVLYTNIASSAKIIRDFDIFLVKILLNAEAVGIYAVARRIAETLYILIDPFFYAIYPELAKLVARGERSALYRLTMQSSLSIGIVSAIAWLGFIVLGHWLIQLFFGASFSNAFNLAAICMLGSVLWAFSQPVAPILYNLGRALDVMAIHFSTAVMYLLALIILVRAQGIAGASIAYAGFFLVWSILTALITRQRLNTHIWKSV